MTVSSESSKPAAPARATRARVPDFFIVGHAKSGTTALYEMLRRHPQIYMPAVKEPYYFAVDNPQPPTRSGRSWRTLEQTGTRAETFDEYLALFEDATDDQRVGEASTHYLWSRTAPERIAAAQPRAQIVAILREPASFLRSLHMQLAQNGHETQKSFRKAIALEDARREGRNIPRHSVWPACLLYTDRVRYVEQLRRYRAAFGQERVLALIYDDFKRDNQATLRTVLRFLQVDDTVAAPPSRANPTVAVRSLRLQTFWRKVRSGQGAVPRAIKHATVALTSEQLRRELIHPLLQRRVVYRAPPAPDERFMLELRRRFKPEVAALSEYLDRDLVALWGYDKLD
ncbi:MAG TPA: sulfotransferase [Solirubrobacteraceae bacterium]|nr:sulfotransferase [Solirubrobacteraceae bacterium]